MSIDVDGLLQSVDLAAVVVARTDIVKRGREWVGLCPFHAESTPSFQIYHSSKTNRDRYHCKGCGAGGDAIAFLMQFHDWTFAQACEELGRPLDDTTRAPSAPRAAAKPEWLSCRPPAGQVKTSFDTRELGPPVRSWEILDESGALLGYVARHPDPDKPSGKVVLTYSWGHFEGQEVDHWECRHFSRPKPLYGLQRLGLARKRQTRPQVILLEGEGKADSAQALFPGSVGMSWLGGAPGVVGNDYTPLRGLQVVLIPDNDEPGLKAVTWLRENLIGMGCEVTVIAPEEDRAKGWNLDDAEREGWTPETALAWARQRKMATQQKAADVVMQAPERPKAGSKPRLAAVDGNTALQPEDDSPAEYAAAFSDMAMTEDFIRRHGEDWRYVAKLGKWLEWRGDGWYPDETNKVKALCERVAKTAAASEMAQKLTAQAMRSLCSSKMVGSMHALLCSRESVASMPDDWDRDPYLLGVPGGTVDLREGKLMVADRDERITRRCVVAPSFDEPTRWLAHLDKALQGDAEVIAFLRRYFGSMLTGDTKDHCLLFLYGAGRNGKGTIVETIVQIMGSYGYAAPVGLLMEAAQRGHEEELLRLKGIRAASCSEPPEGARWDDSRVRWLTGGDTISARGINAVNHESFRPSHHLVILGNSKPKLKRVDDAIKARFNLVNFGVNMTLEADFDKDLPSKLQREWPRILGWMIRGCIEWQETGLAAPKSVRDATNEYLQAEHVVEQWIDDCCNKGGMDPVATCYRSYTKWCERTGERAKTTRAFCSDLYSLPGIRPRATSAARMIDGISLKPIDPGPSWP